MKIIGEIRFQTGLILVLALLLVLNGCWNGGSTVTELTVDKSASLNEVQGGDEFNIQITVHGDDNRVTETIPFEAVLLLDKSDSMNGEKFQTAKSAAVKFIEEAQDSDVGIRIAIVTYGEGVSTIHGLSADYPSLIDSLDDLEAHDLETQIDDAMRRANNILDNGTFAVRVAVLLTDGYCYPDDADQINDIYNIHIPEAIIKSYRYYTVCIGGQCDIALLQGIATSTNGDYIPATEVNLESAFEDIYDEVAHTIVCGQIKLQERVDTSCVEIIPGTFEVDPALPMPSNSLLQSFYVTGEINVPMGELRGGYVHTVVFRVRAKSCLPADSVEESIFIRPNLPNAKVTYNLGTVESEIFLPDVEVKCWKDPSLEIKKEYDSESNTVTLRLTNKYVATTAEYRTIQNISIYEYPSMHYQYVEGTATPQPDAFIPMSETGLLYWHIDELQPQETREFSFEIEKRAYIPRDSNPLRIDAVSKTDGSDSRVTYVLPLSSFLSTKRIPQQLVTAYILDNVPSGRPDLGLRQAFDEDELFQFGLPSNNPVLLFSLPSGGPATNSNWPSLDNILRLWETESIWVDSLAGNSFVDNWDRNNASQVQSGIHHVKVDLNMLSVWRGIEGQGDLFNMNYSNRVYVSIYNSGEGPSVAVTDGILLYAKNYITASMSLTGIWDLIGTTDLPVIEPHSNSLLMFELPANSLQEAHLETFGLADWNVWTAEFRVEISVNENEKHTNNNRSSEKVFVVQ